MAWIEEVKLLCFFFSEYSRRRVSGYRTAHIKLTGRASLRIQADNKLKMELNKSGRVVYLRWFNSTVIESSK